MKRRDFLATLGGIVVLLEDGVHAQETGGGRRGGGGGGGGAVPAEIGAWLHVGETGVVTVYTGKVEVGQNARTSLTLAVLEELRVPPEAVRIVMGDTELVPFDMGTVGSMTTPRMWPQIRRAAAAAREMLLDLAAARWNVDRAALTIADGKVSAGRERTVTLGELARGGKWTRTIPASLPMAAAAEWKAAGKSLAKVNGRDMVTGAHRYSFDLKRPGMLHAKVLYPPQFGATLVSLDASAAEGMTGVKVVHEGNFVAVAAPEAETAAKAVAALKAEWTQVAAEADSHTVFQYFKGTAQGAPTGDNLTAYTIAYIAHVPLEPRAAVAEWEGGKVTVWTGSQRPFGVRTELAQAFGIPESQARVIVPDTGSGYGGKHNGDAALEAARISRALGKTVRRGWTREEEMTRAYFRPGGLIEVGGKAAADGTLAEWEFHNYNSGGSALQSPYRIAARKEQFHQTKSPLRQGSYRGLAATANHFARECFMDELAASVKMDPLEFRLKNAADERLRNVLVAAAEKFGWKAREKTAGRGFGMAAGVEKGGYLATCAEVSVDGATGAVKVLRAVVAFECGAVVNPTHLRNQVEGAVAMGLGGALFEEIRFSDGRIANNRLAKYRVPRFADMPVIESVLLDRKDVASAGAGETPIVGIAPAIGNAIFDATGKRIRRLPLMAT